MVWAHAVDLNYHGQAVVDEGDGTCARASTGLKFVVYLSPAEPQHTDRGAEPLELELPVPEYALRQQDDMGAVHLGFKRGDCCARCVMDCSYLSVFQQESGSALGVLTHHHGWQGNGRRRRHERVLCKLRFDRRTQEASLAFHDRDISPTLLCCTVDALLQCETLSIRCSQRCPRSLFSIPKHRAYFKRSVSCRCCRDGP